MSSPYPNNHAGPSYAAKAFVVVIAAMFATVMCFYLMVMLLNHELSSNLDIEEMQISVPDIAEELEEVEPPTRTRAKKNLPADPPPDPDTGMFSASTRIDIKADQPIMGSLADRIGPIDVQLSLEAPVSDVVPVSIMQPEYPLAAEMREIEGWVIVRFSVRSNGTVANALVVESEPPKIFDQAALNAVSRSRFKPREVGGDQVAVDNIEMKFAFTLDSLYDIPAEAQQ